MKKNEARIIKKAVRFNEESLLLADNEELNKDAIALRKLLQIPSDGFREDDEGLDKWLNEADGEKMGLLYSHTEVFLKRHSLPIYRKEWLRNYILTGLPSITDGFTGVRLSKEPGTDGRDEIHIIISDDTTLEDLKDIWPEVSKLQGKANRKRQPYKNRRRNQRAYQLRKEGKSLSEIAKKISEEFEGTYNDNDVSHILKRYKRKLDSI